MTGADDAIPPAALGTPSAPGAPGAPLASYCAAARGHPVHGPYHDDEYGVPLRDDDRLFERLVLEINQAGLSWLTILKKRAAFHRAYDGFAVERVAAYGESDRARLLADAGIVRNRLKVNAAVENARRILGLQSAHGSFAAWLDAHLLDADGAPRDRAAWQRLFGRTFVFTGGEIVHEFLVSTGYLPGAHDPGCPADARTLALDPPWRQAVARAADRKSLGGGFPSPS